MFQMRGVVDDGVGGLKPNRMTYGLSGELKVTGLIDEINAALVSMEALLSSQTQVFPV